MCTAHEDPGNLAAGTIMILPPIRLSKKVPGLSFEGNGPGFVIAKRRACARRAAG